jgi:methylenetetrahydrofolate dehydrogenase (NADP+)/methenyltetrahydrofolate cyclohydrolase
LDLMRHTASADVIVTAVGVPGLVTREMVKRNATVVDVGITRTEAGLVGDCDPSIADVAGLVAPIPGGVGPLTIAMLLANTVRAARLRRAATEL